MMECCIKSCINSNVYTIKAEHGVYFYRIPENPSMRQIWLQAASLPDCPPNAHFCSEHFDHSFILPSGGLVDDAVPTIFTNYNCIVPGGHSVFGDVPAYQGDFKVEEELSIEEEQPHCSTMETDDSMSSSTRERCNESEQDTTSQTTKIQRNRPANNKDKQSSSLKA